MKKQASIDASWTVNDVIQTFPDTIAVLNAFGIDTCCGGNLTLSEAAAEGVIDLDTLIAELTLQSDPASVA